MRRKITKNELIITAAILFSGIMILIISKMFHNNGNIAVISVDEEKICEINLQQTENKIFTLNQIPNITFEVKNNSIRVINSNCPDKICKNTGFISDTGESIICMPNKMITEIKE